MSVEIVSIKRTGSGYDCVCVAREADGAGSFPVHVDQSNVGGLSAKEQAAVDAAWLILEQHAAACFEEQCKAPEDMHKLVSAAAEARAELTAIAEAEARAKEALAALDAQLAVKRKELAALTAKG